MTVLKLSATKNFIFEIKKDNEKFEKYLKDQI